MLTALATIVAPAPAAAGSVGLYVGSDGIGLSVRSHSWGFYGDSWNDPGWQLDYDVALNGYGDWIWVEGLGRVWHPSVAADWRPYTYGRWIDTPAGWTWVAYEPWGYIPHHFGEWALTVYGWAWVPGYSYRPANVVWVHSGSHVGWYPCAPRGWSHWRRGHDRGYNRGYRDGRHSGYNDGYGDGYWRGWNDARYATFVRWNDMTADDVSRHALSAGRVRERGSTAPLERLSSPPSASEVRRRTGRPVPRAELDQRTVRVGGREVSVSRPRGIERSLEVNAGTAVDRALAPEVSRRVREGRVVTQPGRIDSSTAGRTAPVSSRDRDRSSAPADSRIGRSTRSETIPADRGTGSTTVPRVTRQPAASRSPASSSSGTRSRALVDRRPSTTVTGSTSSRTRATGSRSLPTTGTRSLPTTGRSSATARSVSRPTRSQAPTAVRRQGPATGAEPRSAASGSRTRAPSVSRAGTSTPVRTDRSTTARPSRSGSNRQTNARGGSQTGPRPKATSSSRPTSSGRRDRRK